MNDPDKNKQWSDRRVEWYRRPTTKVAGLAVIALLSWQIATKDLTPWNGKDKVSDGDQPAMDWKAPTDEDVDAVREVFHGANDGNTGVETRGDTSPPVSVPAERSSTPVTGGSGTDGKVIED